MSELLAPFSDPQAVARYAEGPPRLVPGFADLHRMTTILLAEHAPQVARVLVLGAGGGLELKAFAEAHPGWTFDGVDPAAEMLKLAERTLGLLASRVRLHQGTIDDAPEGPFDAATCLLTLHFLAPQERRRMAIEIRRRLKPGAPFVAAHSSFPQGEGERARWLSRYAAFAIALGRRSRPCSERTRSGRNASEPAQPRARRSDPARRRILERQPVLRRVHLPRLGGLRLMRPTSINVGERDRL